MADVEAFVSEEETPGSNIAKYKTLASDIVEPLRKAADAFECGELLNETQGRRLSSLMDSLMAVRSQIETGIEEMGGDISSAHTVEDIERQFNKLETDWLLVPLRAVQDVTASEEEYVAPLKELQDRAGRAAQSLLAAGELPSEESRHVSEQARAVLRVLDGIGKLRRGDEECILADLGISDTFLLGLSLGKYSWAGSAGGGQEKPAESATRTRPQEIYGAAASAAADKQESSAGDRRKLADDSASLYGEEIVHPITKLPKHKPNARRFMKALKACGPLALVVAEIVFYYDVVTCDQVAYYMQRESQASISMAVLAEVPDTIQQLVRRGILAAYRVDLVDLYVLTRFGRGSMMIPKVQRVLQMDFELSEDCPNVVAEQDMPAGLLVIMWMRNSMNHALETWIRKETGHSVSDALDKERFSNNELAIRLPKGYGREDESFSVWPYEAPRMEQMGPTLYIATTEDTVPVEEDAEEQAGSLLLFKGELYECRGGAWIKMNKTSQRTGRPSKRPGSKGKKRKR